MEIISVHKRTRVSFEQRQKMLEFMLAHPDLAQNRVNGSDAARRRRSLLSGLATTLNSCATGATKSPEKWWKCWQDWRSDTKAKAAKIKKFQEGTGGGPPAPPLTAMEEQLTHFIGREASEGLAVPDTLETQGTSQMPEQGTSQTVEQGTSQKPEQGTSEQDVLTNTSVGRPMQNARQRLEDGIEAQAVASELTAKSLEAMAIAITRLAAAIENINLK